MRILIDIEGGLVQGVHVDPDHDKELEVHLIDRDGPENGDARYVGEIACTVDTPAEFDAIIEELAGRLDRIENAMHEMLTEKIRERAAERREEEER